MAFYIPAQHRAVDPYSSYESNNVNQLTRILTNGINVVSKGMEVTISDTTHLNISLGTSVKDDVMVNVTENVEIDFEDGSWFVEGVPMQLTDTGYLYVVLDYTYIKSQAPNTVSYKILKDTSSLPAQYMFIKAVKLNTSGATPTIESVWDWDPSTPSIVIQRTTIQFTITETLPPWTASQRGLMYLVNGGEQIALGYVTGWVYFNTSHLKDYAEVYSETIPSGSFSLVSGLYEYDVTHSLNKAVVNVQCVEETLKAVISPNTILLTDNNTTKLKFSIVPDNIKVIITG